MIFTKLIKTKKTPAIGLDINPQGVTVSVGGEEFFALLPKGIFSNGVIADKEKAAAVIKELFKTKNIVDKNVIIAVSAKNTVLRLMSLPALGPEILKDVIKKEFSKYMIFAGDDFFVDFWVLEELKEKDGAKLDVLAAAAKKETINSYVETLRLAELSLEAIDISSLAVIRAAAAEKLLPKGIVVLAAPEGAGAMIFIFKDGKIQYLHGIDSLKQMNAEMEATIAYCKDKFGADVEIKKITSADLKGVSVAKGLGLPRAIEGISVPRVNLLPLEEIKVKEFNAQCFILLKSLGVLAGLLIFYFLFLRFQTWAAFRNTALMQKSLSAPDTAFIKLLDVESQSRMYGLEVGEQKNIASSAQNQNWGVILEELKKITPKRAFLTSLTSNKEGVINLMGEAAEADTVFDFSRSLKASKYFKNINLEETKDKETKRGINTQFIIKGQLL